MGHTYFWRSPKVFDNDRGRTEVANASSRAVDERLECNCHRHSMEGVRIPDSS